MSQTRYRSTSYQPGVIGGKARTASALSSSVQRLYPHQTMIPTLPKELWMHILTIKYTNERTEWWNNLSEEEQEYEEWLVEPEEMAECYYNAMHQ